MKNIMSAGLQYLGSPKKSVGDFEDSQFGNEDSPEDDAFLEPSPPTENMSILHSALEQQEAALLPSVKLSDASLYKAFCLEAGIIGDTAGFFVWQERHSGVKISTSPVSSLHISDTPANNTGKIHVTRLANAGVLCKVFVSEKLLSGFNKSVFTNAARYDIYTYIRHGAGMGSETVWAFISIDGITPTMCNELVLAQYNETVLDHHDPDRSMVSLLKVLEVTMGIIVMFMKDIMMFMVIIDLVFLQMTTKMMYMMTAMMSSSSSLSSSTSFSFLFLGKPNLQSP
mmetsp:Transcript_21844/g.21136  ORF Transcript_21844/g.21136 Transcript_21844/m.21136 type:complete len:284 (-) Transcript_21844:46-897(-)